MEAELSITIFSVLPRWKAAQRKATADIGKYYYSGGGGSGGGGRVIEKSQSKKERKEPSVRPSVIKLWQLACTYRSQSVCQSVESEAGVFRGI